MTTFQTGYKSYLSEYINESATTIPVATLPVANNGRMMIFQWNTNEWIDYTGKTGSNPTGALTGCTRGMSQTSEPSTAWTGKEWAAGSQIINVQMHDQIVDKLLPLPILSLTTTERDAIDMDSDYYADTAPIIYNETAGQYEYWTGSAWTTFSTGTVANASTTVAGKVEISTDAEITAGTGTGWTGAVLTPTPTQIKKSISLKNTATSIGSESYTLVFNDNGEDKQITKGNFRDTIPASDTLKGTVEKATWPEFIAGSDTSRYVTSEQAQMNMELTGTITTATVTTTGSAVSTSTLFPNGWIVHVDGQVNNNSWSARSVNARLEYSADNSSWSTAVTFFSGDPGGSSIYRNITYYVKPWYYVRWYIDSNGSSAGGTLRVFTQLRNSPA